MEKNNLKKYQSMEIWVGKKEGNLFSVPRPIYDSTSLLSTLKTFFGFFKDTYDGSIMELLGTNIFDFLGKYQAWVEKYDSIDERICINTRGFDGVHVYFDENGFITYVSYGRSFEGKSIFDKAKEFARINGCGLKLLCNSNMRGIYYSVEMVEKHTDKPYVIYSSHSTFRGSNEEKICV